MTLCPSGQGDGLEIHWALPAGARIPSVSISAGNSSRGSKTAVGICSGAQPTASYLCSVRACASLRVEEWCEQ